MSFKVEQMEEKNMVKLVIESTAEEFEAGLNKAYNKDKNKQSIRKQFRDMKIMKLQAIYQNPHGRKS